MRTVGGAAVGLLVSLLFGCAIHVSRHVLCLLHRNLPCLVCVVAAPANAHADIVYDL